MMNEHVTINVIRFDFKVVRLMPLRSIQMCRAQRRIIITYNNNVVYMQ